MTTPQDLDEQLRSRLARLAPAAGREPSGSDGAARAGGDQPGGEPREALPDAREPRTPPDDAPVAGGTRLTCGLTRQVFDAQLTSRHLDLAACWLRSFGAGFTSVGSSGHEANAAVALALRPTDPALLHYRSGAFYCARVAQVAAVPAAGGEAPPARVAAGDAARDILRGLVASAKEPMSGGRYKVFGRPGLHVVPVPAILASHLPRAVGVAYALGRGRRLSPWARDEPAWPPDALVVCSFGDASVNHAPATAALNAAGWSDRLGTFLPLLFVCEDNGLGGAVRSPQGWVAEALRSRPGLHYFSADGCDVAATYDAATRAAAWVRKHRRPAVLHLTTVRLLGDAGDAGEDAERGYRSASEIAADLARDPIVGTARLLVEAGLATPEELLSRYDDIGWEVRRIAEEVLAEPRLGTATEIIAPLAPRRPVRVSRAIADASTRVRGSADRVAAFGGKLPEDAGPLTLAQTINAALTDALLAYPQMIVFGADVAARGGAHGVTRGLRARFGATKVIDTLSDETSIIGMALGTGMSGLLPVPELRSLAGLHDAGNQVRGEAATAQFLSRGVYRNPMVVRVAGLAVEGAPDGHFHNDNAVAGLRDVPGLVVAVPARAEDAAPMLRTCLASAVVDGSVCVFLEPTELYHTRDLYSDGDGWWQAGYRPPEAWAGAQVPIGQARVYVHGAAEDLTIITFGSGVRMSLRAAARFAAEGTDCRVVDLRWLSPLPVADIIRESAATGRVLVVDPTRRSGGVGEGVLAVLVDAGYIGVARRVAAVDSFVPLGPAADRVLVSEEQVVQAGRSLLTR